MGATDRPESHDMVALLWMSCKGFTSCGSGNTRRSQHMLKKIRKLEGCLSHVILDAPPPCTAKSSG